MWDGMKVVQTFLNETEAEIERGRLEAAGFDARLATDNCGGMRPHFDLQAGVHLMVPEDAWQAARELLEATDDADENVWFCRDCGETGEPGFESCWRCGAART